MGVLKAERCQCKNAKNFTERLQGFLTIVTQASVAGKHDYTL